MTKTLSNVFTLVCIGVMVFTVGALFLPTALGYKRYVITGGSMTGTISKGAVIYSKLVPVEELREGDIITFVPPEFAAPVTHRITEVSRDEDGRRVFATKGDFNQAEDPWRLHLVDRVQARYVFHIPYVGYALAMLAVRQVRMLLIGLPAIIIALSLLLSLWKQAGEAVARQEAESRATQGVSVGPAGSTGVIAVTGEALILEWEGPDPFDGRPDSELADLRGWWR